MEINVVKLKEYAASCSVLYVEDDELIRTQTVEFLGRFFPIIDVACNGLEGLEKYNSKQYSIVISDINMPKMNGIEMIEEIRKKNEDQTILVTSAHNDSENLMHLINFGVHRFVLKPFNFKQFIIMLYHIVEDLHFRTQSIIAMKRSQSIVDMMDIGVVVFENFHVTMVNQYFLEIGGFSSLETLLLEVPEIGVMFQPCTNCLNATTNKELINELLTLPPSRHKLRIEAKGNFREFQVKMSDIGENTYALIFADVTDMHNEMSLDVHTKLPSRRGLLEQMEILGDCNPTYNALLVSVKNFETVLKWYRKSDAIGVEIEASSMLKAIFPQSDSDVFIGHYGENKFVIVNNKPFEETILHHIENSVIRYIMDLNVEKIIRDGDLHLTYKTAQITFKAKTSLPIIESNLESEFTMML